MIPLKSHHHYCQCDTCQDRHAMSVIAWLLAFLTIYLVILGAWWGQS